MEQVTGFLYPSNILKFGEMAADFRSYGKSTLNCQPPVEKVTTFALHKLPDSIPFVTRSSKRKKKGNVCVRVDVLVHKHILF